MKRDFDHLNLRDAFGEMPDHTYSALMKAARSVEEERPVKRVTFRTVLIAAAILVATMAVAVAASNVFGWNEFFEIFYGGNTRIPSAGQELLAASEERSFALGPMNFTVQQYYADQHIAMSATQVKTTDGSLALITMDGQQSDPIAGNGENGEQYAKKLGLADGMITWTDAAKELNAPLYVVRAILDIAPEYSNGEAMEDALYDADGCYVHYSMAQLNPSAINSKTLPVRMFLRVAEIDLETGEEKNVLRNYEELDIPVSRIMDSCNYQISEDYSMYGVHLDAVRAEQLPAGVYLYTDFTAAEGMDEQSFMEEGQIFPVWYSADGQRYDWGVNLTYLIETEDWPHFTMMGMISEDEIPAMLLMALEDDNDPDSAGNQKITLSK